ncbi:MAG: hypothetical protein ACREBR_03935, partial [bacterium]
MHKIYSVLQGKAELIDYMKDYMDNRHHFAAYAINTTRGTLMLKGSSIAEANHSSYVRRVSQASTDDLAVVCKSLLQPQLDINVEKHEAISKYAMQAKHEAIVLSKAGDIEASKAVLKLSLLGYKRWCEEREESINYTVVCNGNALGTTTISRIGSSALGRIIQKGGRCNCIASVSEMIQCRHEIIMHSAEFRDDLFDIRWYRRDSITQSCFVGHDDKSKQNDCDSEDILKNEEQDCGEKR